MRLVLQRVRRASVSVAGECVAAIGPGIMALVGFGCEDGPDFAAGPLCGAMLNKMVSLRIFPDADGKLNESLLEAGGELLLVSQFTLYAACRKGRRPSFSEAAPPETAREQFADFCRRAETTLPVRVVHGVFGADMDVSLVNAGPVTILLDSDEFAALPTP